MRVRIEGTNLPGREFCRPDGSLMDNVHVALQEGKLPIEPIRADAKTARWDLDVRVVEVDGGLDFRGPFVNGKRGERFLYLTWGHIDALGHFEMFRRAKLMLSRVDPTLLEAASRDGGPTLVAQIDLTDARGGPRCARVDPPAIEWSLA